MKPTIFALAILASVSAPAQTFDYQFSTNGKNYTLAYLRVTPEKRIKPEWADVTWSFGPVGGVEDGGPGVFGARANLMALDHNTHFYAAVNLNGLFPVGAKPIGVAGLSFGFAWPLK